MKKKSKKKIKKTEKSHEFYRIILTSQNKIIACIYKTLYKKSALTAFNKLIVENKKTVRFPIKYSSRDHKLIESKYEAILMKNKTALDSSEQLLRNEYGKLVPHITNSTKMVIFKKEEYYLEESFWVYGYNPKLQRKDFNFILNEIVLKDLPKVNYPVKTILVFRNKFLIQTDDDIDIVICKCENDAARLYTEIKKEVDSLRYKSIYFSGMVKDSMRRRIEQRLMDKTNWTLEKIRRKSTRP